MSRIRLSVLLLGTVVLSDPVAGQQVVQPTPDPTPLEARVWLDRGDEPVLRAGDQVRVYYRTTEDAEAAIFRIDTDGRVSLVFPARPGADPRVGGGRDFRLLMGVGGEWKVREDPGVGHYFMVASADGLDFRAFEGRDSDREWDLSRVGEAIYTDPYLAIDDYVSALLPDWEAAPYALDFIEYSVGEDHEYPRYLCYDCHDYQPYAAWDPYTYACTTYRVVLYDDPYFYPEFRYVGSRSVFASPLTARPRYAVAVRAQGEGWSPLVRRRSAPALPRGAAQYKEIQAARDLERSAQTRRAVPAASGLRPTAKSPSTASAPRQTGVRPNGSSSAGSVAGGRRPASGARAATANTIRRAGSVVPSRSATARRVPSSTGSKASPRSGAGAAQPRSGAARGSSATRRTGSTPAGSATRGSASPRRTGSVTSRPTTNRSTTRATPRATTRPTSRVTPAASGRRAPSTTRTSPTRITPRSVPRATPRTTPRTGSTRATPTRGGSARPAPTRSSGSRGATAGRPTRRPTPSTRAAKPGGARPTARPPARRPSGTSAPPARRRPPPRGG